MGAIRHESEAAHDELAVEARCVHYWLIESPEGPKSRGVCKLCGAETEFSNYVPLSLLDDRRHEPARPSGLEQGDLDEDADRLQEGRKPAGRAKSGSQARERQGSAVAS
jgi:hypothetical protein